MTPMQELMENVILSNLLSEPTKIIVAAFIDNQMENEKEHLIGMCSIGSRNAGIDPEKVFETRYGKAKHEHH